MFKTNENVRKETMERIFQRHEEMKREIERIQEEGQKERRTKNSDKLDKIDRLLKEIESL